MSNKTTTKRELVVSIANQTGLTQLEVKEVIQRTLDSITGALAQGKTIELRNFGMSDSDYNLRDIESGVR